MNQYVKKGSLFIQNYSLKQPSKNEKGFKKELLRV